MAKLLWSVLFLSLYITHGQTTPPQLNGQHFRITALEESGFLDHSPHGNTFSGYLIDMLEGIAKLANFTYTLLPPSGVGSLCVPRLLVAGSGDEAGAYGDVYRTQYNCGASDVNDQPLSNFSTDMYLGMYYVTPARTLQNQFTIPFNPPFSGTLAMVGTATGIDDFPALVEQQQAGTQPEACAPGGTALIDFVAGSFPGIKVKGIFGGEDDLVQAFRDGTCQIYITDGPIAAQFVLRRSQLGQCNSDSGAPIGVIGEPMDFGLSHYAIGVRRDIATQVVTTISYYMNVLMSCNPLDPDGACPDGNLATFYKGRGGTGHECGYVLYPPSSDDLSGGAIAGIVIASVFFVVLLVAVFYLYQHARQKRLYAKRSRASMLIAQRERELNDFIAHEVRNPLSSAIAALNFVSSKAADPLYLPKPEHRSSMKEDIDVIESSLQFVNELLRNMLDLHRSKDNVIKLQMNPADIQRDVFEPVMSILFMRGASVDVLAECPPSLIVLGDHMRLKQIILNLASNSAKFVEKGYIRLRAEVVDNNILVHVEDSGPGIPADKQEKLFAKFQDSLDELNQGTGIGLSVCKNLSQLMEADLFLDRGFNSGVPGCPGTRFTLRLNKPPLDIENGLGPQDAEETIDDSMDLPEELSVLFVDDDTMIRKMFSRTLRTVAPTWKIREASNGETAIRLVDDERFDLIFIDHYMASHTKQLLGTDTVYALRSKGVTSIICGLSANDKEEEFLKAGASAFMLKPFPCKKEALKRELLRLLATHCAQESVPEDGTKSTTFFSLQ